MRRRSKSKISPLRFKYFFYITTALLLLLTLNVESANGWRSYFFRIITWPFNSETIESTRDDEEVQELNLLHTENHLLRQTLEELSERIQITPPHPIHAMGRIIYRSPTLWNSYCWINIGTKINEEKAKRIVMKNSPVIIGSSLVGIIEKADTHHSLVCLITDSSLKPSVRALREDDKNVQHLAKGYVHGSGESIWRSRGRTLLGTGFNFDFADETGKNKDLRTPSLLKLGDELVTTGLDGVFPRGLSVGRITKIHPLKEGDYFYSLEAEPSAGPMEELSVVFVIPPVSETPILKE